VWCGDGGILTIRLQTGGGRGGAWLNNQTAALDNKEHGRIGVAVRQMIVMGLACGKKPRSRASPVKGGKMMASKFIKTARQ